MLARHRWLYFALGITVALVLGACSLFNLVRQAQETLPTAEALATAVAPTIQAAASALPQPTEAATAPALTPTAQGAEAQNNDDFSFPEAKSAKFQRFREQMQYRVSLPKLSQQKVVEIVTDVVSGQGQHQIMKVDGKLAWETITTAEHTWFRGEDGNWTMLNVGNAMGELTDTAMGLLVAPPVWSTDMEADGTVEVNGLSAKRYHFETNQPALLNSGDWEGVVSGLDAAADITNVRIQHITGEIDALDDHTIVRMTYHITGEADYQGQKTPLEVDFTFEVSHINDPAIKVEPPAEAQAKAPLPLPPGAQLQGSVATMQMYSIPKMKAQEVLQFFEQTLPSQGYTITQKMGDSNQGWLLTVKTPEGKSYHVKFADNAQGDTDLVILP